MMPVGSVTGTHNMQPGYTNGNIEMDAASRSIKKQIENAQKQLQELSANEDMPLEEKMKRRQEIQQEITSLNQQLIQHQIEQRKQQQAKDFSMDNMDSTQGKTVKTKKGSKGNALLQAGMQSIISADSSIKQAKVQDSVATKMNGMANVLESEIKQDAAMGGNTEAKQAALAETRKKASDATSSQAGILAKANQELRETVEEEQDGNADKIYKDSQETGSKDGNSAEITPPVAYKPVNLSI